MKGIWGNLATGLIAGTFLCTSAFASTINGTFSLDGSVVGSTGGLDFYDTHNVAQTGDATAPESGSFTDLVYGTPQVMQNLTSTGGVVPGTSFDFKNWVQLTDGIDLDVTTNSLNSASMTSGIPIPSYPICTSSTPAGSSCLLNSASPVVVTPTADNTGVSLRLTVYGEAHTGASGTDYVPFKAVFSASDVYNGGIGPFLSTYSSTGMVPEVPFAANFFTYPTSSVPEPGSMILLASGLLGFGLLRKRKAAR
jgi:hypothetical protein